MIKVLWVDDECRDSSNQLTPMGEDFVNIAYEKGIEITAVNNYAEGLLLINRNPREFIVIILDVHNQNATEGTAFDDYTQAREEIVKIQTKYNQPEPYIFVYSGNKQSHDAQSYFPQNLFGKRIYDKNGNDYETLLEHIVQIGQVSSLYECQCNYKDVLQIINDRCSSDAYKKLLEIIVRVIVYNNYSASVYVNDMRKILDYIMGVLRDNEYSFWADDKYKEKSLNNLSIYIGHDENVPVYIQRAFHTAVQVTQNGSHLLSVESDVSGGRAPYLLRSCLFELFNIILWVKYYISET